MKVWMKNIRVILEDNPNVLKVGDKQISYTNKFKEAAIKAYQSGKSPYEIFAEAGFDPKMFPETYCSKALIRWSAAKLKYGKKSLTEERRGRKATGRPRSSKTKAPKTQAQLEARLAYLEAENDFLKKLHALAKRGK